MVEKSFTAGAKTLWDKIVMCQDQVVTYQTKDMVVRTRDCHTVSVV